MLRQLRLLILITVLPICAAAAGQDEPYTPEINPDDFVAGIDHRYFPLTPGTTYIYEGEADGTFEHIEVFVTHEVREVMGVECVVVRDRVWEDGALVEDTLDWFAQDRDGNVWYFGEDSREIESGEVVSTAGSWEAGVDGALPGIVMLAEPEVGAFYRQEYYPGEAEDMAEVISLDESEMVAFGTFDELLVTQEWSPLEPDTAEHKYYAAGIGLVLEVVVEGGEGRIELVEITVDDDEEPGEQDERENDNHDNGNDERGNEDDADD